MTTPAPALAHTSDPAPTAHAWATVVTRAAGTGPTHTPTGAAQVAFRTPHGVTGLLDVVAWRRLDALPLTQGTTIDVTVQGRPGHDLRLPLHATSTPCVLTLDPDDTIDVTVGDLREHGWTYGLRLHGARRAPAAPQQRSAQRT